MKKLILFSLFLLLGSFLSFAQVKSEIDNSKTKRVSDIYSFRPNTSNYLLLNQIEDMSKVSNRIGGSTNADNVTIIQQVGNRNTASSNTNSETSSINFFQIGNDNSIQSSSLVKNSAENIIQRGNNNSLTNFSFGNVNSTSLQVLQDGNNLLFEKFGANKLTNSLTFKITGGNQSVVVRSF